MANPQKEIASLLAKKSAPLEADKYIPISVNVPAVEHSKHKGLAAQLGVPLTQYVRLGMDLMASEVRAQAKLAKRGKSSEENLNVDEQVDQ